ncbi:C2 family cysteine protease [Phormidesmis sp. 146-33]
MLFSQSSNKLNALSATSFNSSVLHSSSSALSTGVVDPVQQNDFRLKSSVPSLASTEFASSSASSVVSSRVFDRVSDVLVVDRGIPNKFKTGIDVLEDTSYNKVGHLLNPTLDDTLAGAFDMGRLDGKTRTRLDSIGNGDNTDYTHFRLDQASAFNLFLKGAAGDASVNLLDASGTTIASSYDGRLLLAQGISTTQNFDTHDIALNLSSLAAGDYYLKVSPFWSQHRVSGAIDRLYLPTATTTDYDLTVSTEQVSNLLPTEIDLGNLSGTRLLTGTLDSNNTSEMYRVTLGAGNLHITLSGMNANADVRLIRDSNNDGVISGNEAFASSNQWYGFTDGIYNALKGGTYFIQVNQGQGSTGATINYNLGVSTGDWYTDYLSDFGVVAQARLAGADGWIDRNEMLSILRQTEDYGTIDATELTDLRTVLSGLGHAMPESVRNLANKVINSDPANTRGSYIGNLLGGDSSGKMESLIGKWFLGSDRPIADPMTMYQRANGSLFVDGISWQDVDQGGVGDCYFMASLAAVARTDHTIIDNMITDNGDDTFTVRFYNNGSADYVTVDRFLPTQENGFFYANNSSGKRFDNNTNELWAALVEKAYAQVNESGWLGRDNTNSYAGINSGFSAPVLSQITGRGTEGNRHVSSGTWLWEKDDIGYIINAFNANKPIVLGTPSEVDNSRIIATHAYTLIDYNAGTGRFTLFNPWGVNAKDGIVSLSKDEVIDNFAIWSTTV